MGMIAFQITSVRLFEQSFCQVQIKENIKLYAAGLHEGNSPVTADLPKGPVTRKMYPFDDVIIGTWFWIIVNSILFNIVVVYCQTH